MRVEIDGLLIDDETGEVIEDHTPDDGMSQLELLQFRFFDAKQQSKDWDDQSRMYALAISRALQESGETRASTRFGRSTQVAEGVRKDSKASAVRDAVTAELMTDEEATELLLLAAGKLDVDQVEHWILNHATDDVHARRLKLMLIAESPRAAYVQSRRAARPAPVPKGVSD